MFIRLDMAIFSSTCFAVANFASHSELSHVCNSTSSTRREFIWNSFSLPFRANVAIEKQSFLINLSPRVFHSNRREIVDQVITEMMTVTNPTWYKEDLSKRKFSLFVTPHKPLLMMSLANLHIRQLWPQTINRHFVQKPILNRQLYNVKRCRRKQ
jgi:hypothetical protein